MEVQEDAAAHGKPTREHLFGDRHRLEERAYQHTVQARGATEFVSDDEIADLFV